MALKLDKFVLQYTRTEHILYWHRRDSPFDEGDFLDLNPDPLNCRSLDGAPTETDLGLAQQQILSAHPTSHNSPGPRNPQYQQPETIHNKMPMKQLIQLSATLNAMQTEMNFLDFFFTKAGHKSLSTAVEIGFHSEQFNKHSQSASVKFEHLNLFVKFESSVTVEEALTLHMLQTSKISVSEMFEYWEYCKSLYISDYKEEWRNVWIPKFLTAYKPEFAAFDEYVLKIEARPDWKYSVRDPAASARWDEFSVKADLPNPTPKTSSIRVETPRI
ncbi:hypothetical protein I7I51_06666 [Histoplasma capsulatum]|uniref:Uncharacterized protein n=1 Tax=Ajellomyces capsulatus TaxID=5037 RepID=A0A8A1MH67_AJECA|nr:hypothetical protein I7I51_06666 [Histoplasma capsulatum]